LKIGRGKGFISNPESLSSKEYKQINLSQFFKEKKKLYYLAGSIFLLIVLIVSFL
jgi:hypothetical protein